MNESWTDGCLELQVDILLFQSTQGETHFFLSSPSVRSKRVLLGHVPGHMLTAELITVAGSRETLTVQV